MSLVYVVGTQEDRFIADRVYSEDRFYEAMAYCDCRNKQNLESGSPEWWVVMSAPLGGDWLFWSVVHSKKNSEDKCVGAQRH
jgi:hypothetical protein